jgi:DNA-directed RNA polymerase specialized sigma24 family protein
MPFIKSVAAELPYLRRYARALTGAQKHGDAAVREMLEALREHPNQIECERPARIELFRLFHHFWQQQELPALSAASPLSHLVPRSRQALLLTAVEGFSAQQAAEILDVTDEEVAADVVAARARIAQDLASNVMIIEDETIIALHIKSIVHEAGHHVMGVARTHEEAVKLARRTPPQAVLADISLADGSSGIDAVRDILGDIDVPAIFVTAFPERLLTGDRPEPTYLITKPFDADVLAATLDQALLFHREGRALGLSAA